MRARGSVEVRWAVLAFSSLQENNTWVDGSVVGSLLYPGVRLWLALDGVEWPLYPSPSHTHNPKEDVDSHCSPNFVRSFRTDPVESSAKYVINSSPQILEIRYQDKVVLLIPDS